MYEFKTNTILKKDFLKLNEEDVMFITNPGRMGDEDGTTFIIKNGKELIVYRIDGWMYPNKDRNEDEIISLNDALKKFPKWHETWDNSRNDNYKGKYKFIYMGFGNGLSIDNSIYDEYKPFLDKRLEKYFEKYNEAERKSYEYAGVMNVWSKALVDMADEKQYILK